MAGPPRGERSSSSGGGRGGGRGGDSGGGKPLAKRKKLGASIGIAKFAAAKASTWDKREKQEKERALNAARVNAYRKLQKRMGPAALAPSVPLDQVDGELNLDAPVRPRAPPPEQRVQQDSSDDEQQQQQGEQQQQQQQQQQQHGHGSQWQAGRGGGRGRGRGEGGRGGRGGRGEGGRGTQHKPLSHVQRIAADVQVQKEAEQREREERRRAAEARAAKLAADAKQRGERKKKFMKKTGHGQPVMKYRVEQVLAQLQGGK